jgi:two-component system, NarL family, response regulator NreC
MPIKVLLADDCTLFRQGLCALLRAQTDLEVVGEATDASDAVAQARQLRPDVVLIETLMPGMSSFEATRLIRKDRPETRVVFLSMYDDEEYLAECVDMGASGYILKDGSVEQLLTAIREVHRGGNYLSPRLLTRLLGQQGAGPRQSRLGARLTRREREILKMLAEGRSVKEIATGFELSVKTVDAHKFNLMRKLDIHNKAQLVQYAIQKKVVRLPPQPDVEEAPHFVI